MIRHETLFDDGWSVHVGELALPPKRLTGKGATCGGFTDQTVAERPEHAGRSVLEMMGESAQVLHTRAPAMDSSWVPVNLPHDWRIERPISRDHPHRSDYGLLAQGSLPVDIAYYRKTFALPVPNDGTRIELRFDGVMRDTDLWVNGFWLDHHASGYTGWSADITELLHDPGDGPNVVLLRTDIGQAEGWWYEGSGIYRHVWLASTPELRVANHGIYVTTASASLESAQVHVEIEVDNASARTHNTEVRLTLHDPTGAAAGESTSTVAVRPFSSVVVAADLEVTSPALWEVGNGRIHTARVELLEDEKSIDVVHQSFGIRVFGFTKAGQLTVNGVPQLLYGANLHQDFAGLGVALPDRVVEHKLELLAEMGVNAVRSAHHPATPALLDHADRLGMLVIEENRLLSTGAAHLRDLTTMIKRGRSHPSIAFWSLENEEMNLQATPRGTRLLRRLVGHVKALDDSRPIISGGVVKLGSSYYDELDAVGAHYVAAFNALDKTRNRRPNTPLIGDEEGLFASVRGQYQIDIGRAYGSAFGSIIENMSAGKEVPPEIIAGIATSMLGGPPQGDIGRLWSSWYGTRDDLAGAFVWLGMDCLGEPAPPSWPGVVCSYGARDLIGVPKDYYWLLRAIFRAQPLVHAMPHWTWPGKDGDRLPFRVYSNCDEVEVEVNGRLVLEGPVEAHVARFPSGIVYEPGTLVVRGLDAGVPVVEHRQQTAGQPAAVVAVPDRTQICADGRDVAIVRLRVTDAAGVLAPHADSLLRFSVRGPGRIIGVGNGDPSSHEPHKARTRRAFRGYALVLVQSTGVEGEIVLQVSSEGIPPTDVAVTANSDGGPHQVYICRDEALLDKTQR